MQGGIGLVGFGADGSRLFQVMSGRTVAVELVFRGRAYLVAFQPGRAPMSFRIVDVSTGRVVGTRKTELPMLLDRTASLSAE